MNWVESGHRKKGIFISCCIFSTESSRDIKQENTQVFGLSSFFLFLVSGVYVVVCVSSCLVVGVFYFVF